MQLEQTKQLNLGVGREMTEYNDYLVRLLEKLGIKTLTKDKKFMNSLFLLLGIIVLVDQIIRGEITTISYVVFLALLIVGFIIIKNIVQNNANYFLEKKVKAYTGGYRCKKGCDKTYTNPNVICPNCQIEVIAIVEVMTRRDALKNNYEFTTDKKLVKREENIRNSLK